MKQGLMPLILDPYSKAKYDTIPALKTSTVSPLDPYSKAKYDTIKRTFK